jgi:hypothetical protein
MTNLVGASRSVCGRASKSYDVFVLIIAISIPSEPRQAKACRGFSCRNDKLLVRQFEIVTCQCYSFEGLNFK